MLWVIKVGTSFERFSIVVTARSTLIQDWFC